MATRITPTGAAPAAPDAAARLRALGFSGTLRTDADFAHLTTYRLGGPIRLLAEPQTPDDLPAIGRFLTETGWPHLFIGGGTNLLASSRPYEGLVIRLGEGFKTIDRPSDTTLVVGGAAQTAALLKYCQREVLGG
ncbi:MAG TPA: FAD-binding protein, partial [bacterium]|nr:FAD-binding protein [bacterium]